MSLTWGERMWHVYNDAYLPIIQDKHPESLGRPLRENWPEIWHVVEPLFEDVRRSGEAISMKSLPLILNRRGFLEEAYLAFDLSPIRDGDGPVLGTFNPCQEMTSVVLLQRRLQTLQQIAATSIESGPDQLAQDLLEILAGNARDIPFAALYLGSDKRTFALAASTGVRPGDPWFAESVRRDSAHPWPFAVAAVRDEGLKIENLDELDPQVVAGPWPEAIRAAVVSKVQWSPVRANGVLIIGLSPRLSVDDEYLRFVAQVAEQIAARLGAAHTLAAEARRSATLEVAVHTNREIGAAIGILMSRYRINEDQAFAILTRSSQTENLKLRQVAERIVQSISRSGSNPPMGSAADPMGSPAEMPIEPPAV